MVQHRLLKGILASTFVMMALPVHAHELSLVSGLYKENKRKTNGTDAGGEKSTGLGARYAAMYDANNAWFAEAKLGQTSYDAPAGGKDKSSTDVLVGGGLRHYFSAWTAAVQPFAQGSVAFGKTTSYDIAGTEIEDSGLMYGGDVGLRLNFDTSFFVDLEAPLFQSVLKGTRKEKSNDGTQEKKTERTELFAQTFGSLNSVVVSFGLKF